VSAPREVVINETLAARYFPGEDPIGQRVRVMGPANDGNWADIVGTVADVRNAGLAAPPRPEMFVSVRQIPDRRRTQLYLVLRGKPGDVMTTLPDVRAIVKSIDAGQPMYAISTIDAQFEGGVATRRVATWLLGIFSVLALGLSGLGLFGVLWHGVSERQREIGLRFALGADGAAVMRLMLWQALRPVLLGLTAGLVGLVAGRQVLSGWLYGITPQAAPLAMVAAVVLLVSVVASAWPVIRASRLSPLEALTPGRRA
jgi:putative ABC transport system permease protein